jgi:transcriptional regulator with XRE-family HTH domain
MTVPNTKLKEIQKRLVSALKYYRIANRLTANEITERTGVNFYLIESGKRPVTIPTIIKLESVFGQKSVSNLLNHAWHGEGEWNEESLLKRTRAEQDKWDGEKKLAKGKKKK